MGDGGLLTNVPQPGGGAEPQVYETGAAGATPKIFRQTGGTPGTDEVQVTYTGSQGKITCMAGSLEILCVDDSEVYIKSRTLQVWGYQTYVAFNLDGNGLVGLGTLPLCWNSNSDARGVDTVLWRRDVAVLEIGGAPYYSPSVGGVLQLGQMSDLGTPNTDCVRYGAEEVSSSAEAIVTDEADTEQQLTSHRCDGPDELYDDIAKTGFIDLIGYERQRVHGKHRYRNTSRRERKQDALNETVKRMALKMVEKGLMDESDFSKEDWAVLHEPSLRETCEHVETLEEYGKRRPEKAHIQKRDWQASQDAKQAAYDSDRQADMDKITQAESAHVQALDAHSKLSDEEKAKRPTPKPTPVNPVRPGKDVRKDPPEWMVSLGIAQPIVREGK